MDSCISRAIFGEIRSKGIHTTMSMQFEFDARDPFVFLLIIELSESTEPLIWPIGLELLEQALRERSAGGNGNLVMIAVPGWFKLWITSATGTYELTFTKYAVQQFFAEIAPIATEKARAACIDIACEKLLAAPTD